MGTRWIPCTGVFVAAACALASVVLPAETSGAAHLGERTMLVFFRHLGTSPRSVLGRELQSSVLTQATQLGVQVLVRDTALGAATVRVTTAQARALASNPFVVSVLPNTLVPGPVVQTVPLHTATTAKGTPAHASCGTAAKPQLNPEALGNINALKSATGGYDGAGVTVAFLADGLDPANADLARNASFATRGSPAGSRIATYKDFGGDGTNAPTLGAEAFGDAASIAAQGNVVYDLSKVAGAAHPLPNHCDIRIRGVAPGASLLALNVFGFRDQATAAAIVEAINYAVTRGAKVINESFGFNNFPDTSVDIVRQADEAAVVAGVTVVVSSGDAGPDNTIASPASDPAVLTVGATTTYRAYAQLTFGGINALGSKAGYLDNNISSFSSGGIAPDGKTVDLVAPGDLGWAICSKSRKFFECGGRSIQLFGGTSESAPLTAGAAALVIEAYKKTHGGVAPSPQLVMQILTSSAVDTSAPAVLQGAGLLDVGAAVRLATSVAGTTLASPPGGVQSDTTQMNLVGLPSSAQSGTFALTNTSTSTATVQLSTRSLVPASTHVGTTILDTSSRSHDRVFIDSSGLANVYRRVAFSVPTGTARVVLQTAFGASGISFPSTSVSLFAPNGDLAAYSLPQGFANYADVEASAPRPGRWTAVIFQPRGFGGKSPIHWKETNFGVALEGTVTPSSVVLNPGETTGVRLDVTMPSASGDSGLSIVVASGAQHTTIPVTLRATIALSATGGTFSGVLTGGNGRGGAAAQSNTYSFTVPAGERDLDVGIAMDSNPANKHILLGDEFGAYLVDPSGSTQAFNVNATLASRRLSRYCNLYVASPSAGTWRLILRWVQPLDGWAASIPFDGSIGFNTVQVSGHLPDAAATTIPKAGATFVLRVHNAGTTPMDLSRDARLAGSVSMKATSLFSSPPRLPGAFSIYYLPTSTQSVEFQQTSSVPGTFQSQSAAGDPLLGPTTPEPFQTSSWTPTSSMLTYSPPGGVPPGEWVTASGGVGPFPAKGAPSGSLTQVVHVTAPAFDPAVSSKVPDLVQRIFTQGDTNLPLQLLVAPGATATIPIKINPKAATGTVVSGTLYIVQAWPELIPETLAAIPYQYTVGI